MPWIVGIDEAGYGPNLGPLVMTSVACRVPPKLASADLWEVLSPAVRRHTDEDDGRLLLADSKLVYSPSKGLHDLERGVLATANGKHPGALPDPASFTLAHFLEEIAAASHPPLRAEPWYRGTSRLPVSTATAHYHEAGERFEKTCRTSDVRWGPIRSVVVCASRFNALMEHWGSKAAVLGEALGELLEGNRDPADDTEAVHFVIDKHGGRNTYTAMLQNILTDGTVVAQKEGSQRSVYQVLGLRRAVQLTFQPRADAEHLCVALASMVSKYVRELLMGEFNAFWRQHVADLEPTAGYPGDAARFFAAIGPAVKRLGIPEAALWRKK